MKLLRTFLINSLLFLALFAPCHADDNTSTLVDVTTPEGLTQLNDKLRMVNDRIAGFSTQAVDGSQLIGLNNIHASANALPIANGGTGQTTAQTAIDALLPSQSSNSGKFLTTNGTNSSWGSVSSSGYSNVLFQWHGNSIGNGGASQTTEYIGNKAGGGTGTLTTKFIKISGVSTVTVYQRCADGLQGYINLTVGSASTGSVLKGGGWTNVSLDVSGLTNGTAYDVTYTVSSAGTYWVSDLIAFGS